MMKRRIVKLTAAVTALAGLVVVTNADSISRYIRMRRM
jgi:hypothetical protein